MLQNINELFDSCVIHCFEQKCDTVLQWEHWRDMELENELQLVMSMIVAVRRLQLIHRIKDKPEGDTYIYI